MTNDSIYSAARRPSWLVAIALLFLGSLPAAAQETVLYGFLGGPDGSGPAAGVIFDSAGNLYGTTYGAGASGAGVVFKLDTTGHETVLYAFTGGADGGQPQAGVIFDSAGNLYGTTYGGGASRAGVVFKLDTAGHETVLHSFTGGADGYGPLAGVILDSAGNLYGSGYTRDHQREFGRGPTWRPLDTVQELRRDYTKMSGYRRRLYLRLSLLAVKPRNQKGLPILVDIIRRASSAAQGDRSWSSDVGRSELRIMTRVDLSPSGGYIPEFTPAGGCSGLPGFQQPHKASVSSFLEQRRAQVALGRIRQNYDERLALELLFMRQTERRRHGRSARNTAQDAFFASQPARGFHSLLIGDGLHAIHHGEIQRVRNETRPQALDLGWTGLHRFLVQRLRNHRTARRLHAHRKDLLVLRLLDIARNARDGPPGADAGYQDVDGARGVGPNLRPGGLEMNSRIGRILELLQQDIMGRISGHQFQRLGNGPGHALFAVGKQKLGAQRLQDLAPLDRHGVGHGQRDGSGSESADVIDDIKAYAMERAVSRVGATVR
jgi:uncharacterized repeat protein (TIGR03803 family)